MATSVYAPAVFLTMLLLGGTAQGSVLRGGASQTAVELPTFPNIKCVWWYGGLRRAVPHPRLSRGCAHYLMRRYLGLGYNVVTGNPFTNGADPGFAPESRQQMLKLTYTEGRQCVGVLLGGFTAALRALERPLLVW